MPNTAASLLDILFSVDEMPFHRRNRKRSARIGYAAFHPVLEIPAHKFFRVGDFDMSDHRNDGIRRHVEGVFVGVQIRRRHCFQGLFGAQNGVFEGMSAEKRRGQPFKTQVVGRILALAELFQHDFAFLVHILAGEKRIEIHIRQHVQAFFRPHVLRHRVKTRPRL